MMRTRGKTTLAPRLRSGLQAGLKCASTDKGSLITYECGSTKCNLYTNLNNWGCRITNKPGLYPGQGLQNMKNFIAFNNNVSSDQVKLG